MRPTVRALSVAFVAGAAFALAGPVASAAETGPTTVSPTRTVASVGASVGAFGPSRADSTPCRDGEPCQDGTGCREGESCPGSDSADCKAGEPCQGGADCKAGEPC
ncbi:hypothetical protein AB0G54_02740, partial [Streptomyces yokosukanensis]